MRRLPVPAWVLDCALAVAMAVFVELELRQPWDDGERYGSLSLNSPLVALAVLPLALRSTAPGPGLAAMAVVIGLPSLFAAHTILFWGGFVPVLLMIYSAARRDTGPLGRWAWLADPLLLAAQAVHVPQVRSLNEVAFNMIGCLTAYGIGRGLRHLDDGERELSAALHALAEQRTERETRAVVDERSRIAGEMHDVVAHAVSLMVLQVGAARFEVETAGTSPGAAAQLRAAEGAGRSALDQLRRSLSVLRKPGGRAEA